MLFALTVTRNEAGRYLDRMLASTREVVDGHFVFDDQSEDDTPTVCEKAGCEVVIRGDSDPAFVVSEGRFRHAAWLAFETTMRPSPGDWVLSIDADEVLVSPFPVVDLPTVADHAASTGYGAVRIPIPEVWAFELHRAADSHTLTPKPKIRVDGMWAGLGAPRLFAYETGGSYRQVDMACGPTPTYVDGARVSTFLASHHRVTLLHLGYLDPADRRAKVQRYAHRPGHNPRHVASILTPRPSLIDWEGPVPQGGWA